MKQIPQFDVASHMMNSNQSDCIISEMCNYSTPNFIYEIVSFVNYRSWIPFANLLLLGRGGGQVVSMIAFYSDDPRSNPADVYSFFCKICVWKERK